jgi:glyoxylase I family protein
MLEPTSRQSENAMPKIKHIAISAKDVDATAKFFSEVFGMKEVGKFDGHGARGYYLSDGDLNLAILNFKNDAVAGAERGKDWYGLHHIGFQVESLDQIHEKLAAVGSQPRDDVNAALGVGRGQRQESNVEVKYAGPDGVMIDVSETGWSGTARSLNQEASKERVPELTSA